ncbi:vicianin hydrolase-like [Ziziphus jujuba]|uniref:Vicianin hydrolase-like n=1 Tax=Ziziphus jujuba TaxID=326968 RepID=A0ABM3I8V1_ZIZJJ|nr:vicianin hydrolase-like [Ziziphus jujuba]
MALIKASSIFFFCFLALASFLASIEGTQPTHHVTHLNRSTFPKDFIFGAGSAAYQSEGAAHIDGRGPSIWDVFTREQKEKIADGSNGDVADDFYHRYKDDIKLMKKIGLNSYRFSISWSRILPKGKLSGGVNPLGIKFYNNLINELLANGLQPFVTLFHFDLPQALQEEYGGFLSPKIVKDFTDFADICFKSFGDRVKLWATMNEPNGAAINGYSSGIGAPGRCSSYAGNCTAGNSATEPYIVAHNMLISHASAVKLYRQKYKPYQKGQIGITLVTHWFEPKHNTSSSRLAASRALDFFLGWFAHPITYGDYPESIKSIVANRLPKFTGAEAKLLRGSIDFFGINYYTTNYAESAPLASPLNRSYVADRQTTLTTEKNGKPIGTPTALSWLFIYPQGLKDLLVYIKNTYKNPPIYITENGMADVRNDSIPVKVAIKDSLRIRYHHGHISSVLQALKQGANVKAYFVWSYFDDFEWDAGFTVRFGICYVDFKDNLKRYLKYSAYWLKMFLLN